LIGPYIIKIKYPIVASKLVIVDGKIDKFLTNAKHLKPFYA